METKDLQDSRNTKNIFTPYCCNARRIKVLSPVRSTPIHMGMLKSMFNAKAVPITGKEDQQNEMNKHLSYQLTTINGQM